MEAFGYFIPAVKVKAQGHGLYKKGGTFQRKRHTYNRPGILHKARPQQAQLKRQRGTRYGTGYKKYGHALLPRLGKGEVLGAAGTEPFGMAKHHKKGHYHTDTGKYNVKNECECHLHSCGI